MPRPVTTHSPRVVALPALNRVPFTGAPKWGTMCADHLKSNPTFEGAKGTQLMPFASKVDCHAPSEPSRRQLPPPSAMMAVVGVMDCGP